jgi:hypothetical protein
VLIFVMEIIKIKGKKVPKKWARWCFESS